MKSTGVIRRIDELGRIVIPKEIRKTLRIHDGDNLEIFTDEKENIILSKYSSIGVLSELSKNIVQVINKNINCEAIITDNDKVIAASNNLKKALESKEISNDLLKYLNKRETYINEEKFTLKIINEDLNGYFLISPIIVNSDSIGLIIIYSKENKIDDFTCKLVQIINSIFIKYLED